jgi:hypothetical protein
MDIIDAIFSYLPAKRKQTPSGWTKFNAVCCHHNGTSADTRQRAGVIKNGDGITYHCFNCGYKTSYQHGRHLTRKMRNLLSWMGASDDAISKLALEAMKIEGDVKEIERSSLPLIEDRELPKGSIPLLGLVDTNPALAIEILEYVIDRNLDPKKNSLFWSPEFSDRFIIPFYYQGRLVGYTARKIGEGRPKYISDQSPGYVYNLDQQHPQRKFVIVVEGPIDAASIGGVAILGNSIMDKQAMLINRLDKRVVLLPDRDENGAKTVEQALDLGWSVSMPDWDPSIKDANDAVSAYGRIYTLRSIIESAENSAVKIRLRMKAWFKS